MEGVSLNVQNILTLGKCVGNYRAVGGLNLTQKHRYGIILYLISFFVFTPHSWNIASVFRASSSLQLILEGKRKKHDPLTWQGIQRRYGHCVSCCPAELSYRSKAKTEKHAY